MKTCFLPTWNQVYNVKDLIFKMQEKSLSGKANIEFQNARINFLRTQESNKETCMHIQTHTTFSDNYRFILQIPCVKEASALNGKKQDKGH